MILRLMPILHTLAASLINLQGFQRRKGEKKKKGDDWSLLMPPNKGATLTGWLSCIVSDVSWPILPMNKAIRRGGQIVSCKNTHLSSMLVFAAICSSRICPKALHLGSYEKQMEKNIAHSHLIIRQILQPSYSSVRIGQLIAWNRLISRTLCFHGCENMATTLPPQL